MSKQINENTNKNFDINSKYQAILESARYIVNEHLLINSNSEANKKIALAYDVKMYLPILIKENADLNKTIKKNQTIINELVDQLDNARCENIDLKQTIEKMAEHIFKQELNDDFCKLYISNICNQSDYDGSYCMQCIINHFKGETE